MSQKLTKSFVEKIPFPESGQVFYRDSDLKGFALRVGSKSKVYVAESKANGKTVRVTIGKHGVFTAEEAKQQAKMILGTIAKGVNPNDIEKEKRAQSITLIEVLEDFLKARKNLKPSTVKDYRRALNTYLVDWRSKPIIQITRDMVERMHRRIGERSPAQANLCMRYVRALINFAMAQYEDSKGEPFILHNPVKRLSQTRAWYRIERRQTLIKFHELADWYQAVANLANDPVAPNRETVRDYLILILFTGLRRSEAAQLTWDKIDLKSRILTIIDTKNHEDHVLPLPDYLCEMLTKRKQSSESVYVFPKENGSGYLVDPKKQMQRVIRESGIEFTLHDLRRTFITIAESLDIPAYALKRLLNHKMNNDVTAGYIITDVERLRQPMQKVTDYILKCIGLKESAPIIPISTSKVG